MDDPVPTTTTLEQPVETVRGRGTARLVIAVILLLGIASATAYWIFADKQFQTTQDAYVEGRIVRISPRVAGQVIALRIDDNTPVRAGDVLFEIDPADYQARVDQTKAAVLQANSSVDQAKAVVVRAEASVGESEAAVRVAETTAKRTESDYRRFEAMGTDGISQQQLEAAKAAADSTKDQVLASQKKLLAARAEVDVARTNVAATNAQVSAATAQLELAELQLQYTKVLAPESGIVTRKNVEAGAFVSAGQTSLAIAPVDRWIVANFKEVQLTHMHPGQHVTVRIDTYPNAILLAKIESLQTGTGSRFQLLPPENATGNWVKIVQRVPVKIVFDPGQPLVERIVHGMSAEVSVDTRSHQAAEYEREGR